MPFSTEDKIIIKHYRQTYKWGSVAILRNLGKEKDWTRRGIDYLLQKIDAAGSHERKKGADGHDRVGLTRIRRRQKT